MGDLQFAKQFLTTLDNKPTKYQSDHVFDPQTFQLRVPYTLPKLPHPPHPLPPKSTPAAPPAPGAERSPANTNVSITLKSNRNPSMTFTIPSINPAETSIQSLREQIQTYLGGSSVVTLEKIKILSNKKPIPSSKKTVAEALEGGGVQTGGDVEFGVMVMGGAPDPPPQPAPPPQTQTNDEAAAAAGTSSTPDDEKMTGQTTASTSNTKAVPEPEPMEIVDDRGAPAVQPGEPSGKEVISTSEFWTDLQGFLEQRLKDSDQAAKLRELFERSWRSTESTP